ncbi:DNA/RNA non-specific endonuclease [Gemmata sp. JC717]|uniref:DNA/RNA non-specific endonuclease n=1 Tax=Gemmata algarum TaxID=2975278 RepID=UPI0021BA8E37|nr:DNA/RNA non-specific endonuclease [Gemmata algarum]MDY3556057.1 DNA/RNA non-specific endonuclease [Gemmata algarum]
MASKNFLDTLTPTQRIVAGVLVLIIGGIAALLRIQQEKHAPPGGPTNDNRNVRFGTPAPAERDPNSRDAYLIERPQYALSYNDSKRTANWVCWNLTKGDIGNTPRLSHFDPDPDLPGAFRKVKHDDYTGSGFDRGHLCPSKDRTDSADNNAATFYTTNIVPQSPACNRGGWERFESHCRDLTRDGSELHIAAGPHGTGGTGEKGPHDAIGGAKVNVPSATWKVVLVVPAGTARPGPDSKMLAVWMPNDQSVPEAWKPYQVSVATVEQRTGYKFFPLVPDDIAAPLKAREP